MKITRALILMSLSLSFSLAAFAADVLDAKLVEKMNAYVGQCNGPAAEPKPKMAEFVKYVSEHGYKDAKVDCGVSNQGPQTPMLLIHTAEGGEFYVNFKKKGTDWKVSEVIEDRKTPEGMKRRVAWPAPKK